jgi:ankyrin repeat protein
VQPIDHLIAAALTGDTERVRESLRADPTLLDARNMFGAGVAHAAHYGGHPDLLDLPEFAGWVPGVLTSAQLGNMAAVQQALAADAGQATAFFGSTSALHAAVYWGQYEVAELLLRAGADAIVNEPTQDTFLQITPLGAAVATTPGIPQPSDDEAVVLALVRLLLGHGADVTARRKDGMTPLHGAAWRGHAAVAQALLDAGADPRVTATSGPHAGQTAADAALSQGHLVLAARLDPA